MGVDPISIAMISAAATQGAGSILSSRSQNSSAKKAQAQQDKILAQAQALQQGGPSAAENALWGLFGQNQKSSTPQAQQLDLQSLLSGTGFNAGQDGLLQMLRATPQSNVDKSLNATLENQGNPFDTSELFKSLGLVDQRNLDQSVTGLRGNSTGLGQRFGSSNLVAETALRQNAANDTGVRNAQIQSSSFESAQNRALQAAQQLTGREQFNSTQHQSIAQALIDAGLNVGNLGLNVNNSNNASMFQAAQLGLQNQTFGASLLNNLLAAEQNRRGFNLQTLGLGAGLQPISQPGYGGAVSDVGQLAQILPLLLQFGRGGGGGTTTR